MADLTHDDVRHIVQEELQAFGTKLLHRLNPQLQQLREEMQATRQKPQKQEGQLYVAVKAYLDEHRDEWVRPGAIVKAGAAGGAGPQPVGMVLRRMASQGIVEYRELPATDTGFVAREYHLNENPT